MQRIRTTAVQPTQTKQSPQRAPEARSASPSHSTSSPPAISPIGVLDIKPVHTSKLEYQARTFSSAQKQESNTYYDAHWAKGSRGNVLYKEAQEAKLASSSVPPCIKEALVELSQAADELTRKINTSSLTPDQFHSMMTALFPDAKRETLSPKDFTVHQYVFSGRGLNSKESQTNGTTCIELIQDRILKVQVALMNVQREIKKGGSET